MVPAESVAGMHPTGQSTVSLDVRLSFDARFLAVAGRTRSFGCGSAAPVPADHTHAWDAGLNNVSDANLKVPPAFVRSGGPDGILWRRSILGCDGFDSLSAEKRVRRPPPSQWKHFYAGFVFFTSIRKLPCVATGRRQRLGFRFGETHAPQCPVGFQLWRIFPP